MALMVSANNLDWMSIKDQWGDRPINVYFTPATTSSKSSISITDGNDTLATGSNSNINDIYIIDTEASTTQEADLEAQTSDRERRSRRRNK